MLLAGASYPPITVTANISLTTTGNATSTATVSGGGAPPASSSDLATIAPNLAIPALDPRVLVLLALVLALIGHRICE